MQARRRIFVFDLGSLVLLTLFGSLGPGGKPRAFGHPDVAGLSGLSDGEDALRHARAKAFIDNAKIERHGDWSAFVGPGVKKLAVHGDGDGNQVRFTVGKELDQSERARSFRNRGFAAILRDRALRRCMDGGQERDGEQCRAI